MGSTPMTQGSAFYLSPHKPDMGFAVELHAGGGGDRRKLFVTLHHNRAPREVSTGSCNSVHLLLGRLTTQYTWGTTSWYTS